MVINVQTVDGSELKTESQVTHSHFGFCDSYVDPPSVGKESTSRMVDSFPTIQIWIPIILTVFDCSTSLWILRGRGDNFAPRNACIEKC